MPPPYCRRGLPRLRRFRRNWSAWWFQRRDPTRSELRRPIYWLVQKRGARPGKPGRQTAAASRRTPHGPRRAECRLDGRLLPSNLSGAARDVSVCVKTCDAYSLRLPRCRYPPQPSLLQRNRCLQRAKSRQSCKKASARWICVRRDRLHFILSREFTTIWRAARLTARTKYCGWLPTARARISNWMASDRKLKSLTATRLSTCEQTSERYCRYTVFEASCFLITKNHTRGTSKRRGSK